MSLTRKQPGPGFFPRIEHGYTLGYAAQVEGAIQVFEELRSNRHTLPIS
jgi:hypothetical protein